MRYVHATIITGVSAILIWIGVWFVQGNRLHAVSPNPSFGIRHGDGVQTRPATIRDGQTVLAMINGRKAVVTIVASSADTVTIRDDQIVRAIPNQAVQGKVVAKAQNYGELIRLCSRWYVLYALYAGLVGLGAFAVYRLALF